MSRFVSPSARNGARSDSPMAGASPATFFGQVHDRDVNFVEARVAMVTRDLQHRLLEPLGEERSMSEAAVTRAQALGGGKGREFITPQVHTGPDGVPSCTHAA
jgi:hypothetical protein